MAGRPPRQYVNETVDYTEALFVVVIMALASTRPVIALAERSLHSVARLGGATPAAWWVAILTIAPLMGSFITEPAAMTIAAVLLGRKFYDLNPSPRLKYATLGLLFVNVSIGGTLTHFAAPPVLMVARHWNWDTAYMATNIGWRAVVAIVVATAAYFVMFRGELQALSRLPPVADVEQPEEDTGGVAKALLPVPAWVTTVHVLFIAWTVFTSHYPALFLGGFLFFLGFAGATAAYQSRVELRGPLLVGFFLGGLVIHGGLQSWWIAPVLASLSEPKLFFGATILTAFNDNALITYLATLVPNLDESLKRAVVEGRRHRRRFDGHRQRAESRRPVAAVAVLRRRHPAGGAFPRRASPDVDRDRRVQADLSHVPRATCHCATCGLSRATCDVLEYNPLC